MSACALSLIVPENGYALTVPGVTVSGKNYTVGAPGGVGDVVALTNLLTQLNALSKNERDGSTVWLNPGVYNLKDVYMDNANHLVFSENQGGMIAGLGENREDTILLGGGEDGGHRVLSVKGSKSSNSNVPSMESSRSTTALSPIFSCDSRTAVMTLSLLFLYDPSAKLAII